jgi:hypothetical protein
LYISKDLSRSRKKRILYISQEVENQPLSFHKKIKLGKYKQYIIYKGLRIEDRPQKKVILAIIARNNQQLSKEIIIRIGCK